MSDKESLRNLNNRILKNGGKTINPNETAAERKKALKAFQFDVKMKKILQKNQTTDSNN